MAQGPKSPCSRPVALCSRGGGSRIAPEETHNVIQFFRSLIGAGGGGDNVVFGRVGVDAKQFLATPNKQPPLYTHTRTHTNTHIDRHTDTHTHTYTHTDTHTRTRTHSPTPIHPAKCMAKSFANKKKRGIF